MPKWKNPFPKKNLNRVAGSANWNSVLLRPISVKENNKWLPVFARLDAIQREIFALGASVEARKKSLHARGFL